MRAGDSKTARGIEYFVTTLLLINFWLDVINKKFLNSFIPNQLVAYSFWLSLGLFLGFRLAKFYYSRNHQN